MTVEAANPNLQVSEKVLELTLELLTEQLREKSLTLKKVKSIDGIIVYRRVDPVFDQYILVRDDNVIGRVELEPTQHSFLKTPHSMILAPYRGKGLIYKVYDFLLSSGICMGSGESQSKSANILWSKLAKKYPWFLVNVKGSSDFIGFGSIEFIGQSAPKSVLNKTITRIILLGRGWDLEKFRKKTGMKMKVTASTYRNKAEAVKAAEALCQELVAYGDYTLNDLDKTIVSSCDVHEVQANLQAIGYRPWNLSRYDIDQELGNARFLERKGHLVMLRVYRNGWSSRIVLLGRTPRFDLVADVLSDHTKDYPELGIYTRDSGVYGLTMKVQVVNQEANVSLTDAILKNIGFQRQGRVFVNRTLDMTASVTGNVITFLDQ